MTPSQCVAGEATPQRGVKSGGKASSPVAQLGDLATNTNPASPSEQWEPTRATGAPERLGQPRTPQSKGQRWGATGQPAELVGVVGPREEQARPPPSNARPLSSCTTALAVPIRVGRMSPRTPVYARLNQACMSARKCLATNSDRLGCSCLRVTMSRNYQHRGATSDYVQATWLGVLLDGSRGSRPSLLIAARA